ncbi:MAG TPA: enolase C-terminal domain-like protein [Vicinamibacteria bacterium]|nr:enolase C-terminal domain-like protein [Vicinamibacteria bacterium]
MRRRQVFGALGALGGARLAPSFAQQAREEEPLTISDVETWQLTGSRQTEGIARQSQVQPLHVYPEHALGPYPRDPRVPRETREHRALYLKIRTSAGVEGLYGAVDPEAAVVVERQLKGFLVGKDPLAVEALWDKLYRLNRHSRAGHYMMALSAVDNALWDLAGRRFGVPVYRLLGGPTRPSVEAYASCLGDPVEPELVAKRCVELKEQGFSHQKWFFAHGPSRGTSGLLANVALVRTLREALGDDYEIMFDAFNGWDLGYAKRWAALAERYRPLWIEEPFSSEKLDSFAELRRSTSIPVATGEHFYGRWEVNRFLRRDALDVVQADPEWCGGVSELVKICALASAGDVHVVPHGHNIHAAIHVVASQSPLTCPLVEYLVHFKPGKAHFEKEPLVPVGGRIALPTRPGFGIELDESKIQKRERFRA